MPLPTSLSDPPPSAAAIVRDLLAKYGLRAKKSWGQNFLVNDRAYQAIVYSAGVGPGDVVVEIGAGLGTLTARLLATGARVVAVEHDRDMCAVLEGELAQEAGFQLRAEDALQLDLAKEADRAGMRLVLVGNLPYQISSPLLFRFLDARAVIRRMVLMLQREVAQRLLAQPGTEHYSALSAQVQMLADVRRICQVGPASFIPQPRVDSMVVLVEPLPAPRAAVQDLNRYRQVVRAAFGQRRKTLRNALSAVFGAAAEPALLAAGIDATRRGETLTIVEFARIADQLLAAAPPDTQDDAGA